MRAENVFYIVVPVFKICYRVMISCSIVDHSRNPTFTEYIMHVISIQRELSNHRTIAYIKTTPLTPQSIHRIPLHTYNDL